MKDRITRRTLLKTAAGSAAGAAVLSQGWLSHALAANRDALWQQFQGTRLNFISENTPPTSAIAADHRAFTELTGIEINISQMELGALVQKVALDFASGRGSYHIIYADPYQVLAPYHNGFVDLNRFMDDNNLPAVPKGIADFIPTQLEAGGRFLDNDALYALPYDTPTMIWMYRRDLFEKYHDRMQADLGYDPTPSDDSTWQQYYEIAQWFGDNAKEVRYGTGHQAKQYDSLMADFSNVLFAHGGDYFKGEDLGLIGSENPGPCMLDQPEAIQAAEFYAKLLKIADPGSTSWDWTGVNNAFEAGRFAMTANWHEFASSIERSESAGKVGYARLPKGPAHSANMWGGTGIGINAGISDQEQQAAWLFLVWATAPKTQLANLKSKVGGGTPTRSSVYDMPQVEAAEKRPSEMPNMLTANAVLDAWKPENIGLRPKIPMWNEVDTIIYTEVSKMLAGQNSPKQAMQRAKAQIDAATGA